MQRREEEFKGNGQDMYSEGITDTDASDSVIQAIKSKGSILLLTICIARERGVERSR